MLKVTLKYFEFHDTVYTKYVYLNYNYSRFVIHINRHITVVNVSNIRTAICSLCPKYGGLLWIGIGLFYTYRLRSPYRQLENHAFDPAPIGMTWRIRVNGYSGHITNHQWYQPNKAKQIQLLTNHIRQFSKTRCRVNTKFSCGLSNTPGYEGSLLCRDASKPLFLWMVLDSFNLKVLQCAAVSRPPFWTKTVAWKIEMQPQSWITNNLKTIYL